MLVICAREGQLIRIGKLLQQTEYKDKKIMAFGWWSCDEAGLITTVGTVDKTFLFSFDAVVILDKRRIDSVFDHLISAVEALCTSSNPKT